MKENCQYNGNVVKVMEPGSIDDANECQQACIDFESGLSCQYWKFEYPETSVDNKTSCILFDSWEAAETCTAVHGPSIPFHSRCGPKYE